MPNVLSLLTLPKGLTLNVQVVYEVYLYVTWSWGLTTEIKTVEGWDLEKLVDRTPSSVTYIRIGDELVNISASDGDKLVRQAIKPQPVERGVTPIADFNF